MRFSSGYNCGFDLLPLLYDYLRTDTTLLLN